MHQKGLAEGKNAELPCNFNLILLGDIERSVSVILIKHPPSKVGPLMHKGSACREDRKADVVMGVSHCLQN